MILELYGILKDAYELYLGLKEKVTARISFSKMYKDALSDCKNNHLISPEFASLLENDSGHCVRNSIKKALDQTNGERELELTLRKIVLDLKEAPQETEVSSFFSRLFFHLLQSQEYSEKIIRMRTDIELSEVHQLVKSLYCTIENGSQNITSHAPRILTRYAPKMQESLVGRENDLDNILTMLSNKSKIVIVNGMGGIGKTALCRALFHDTEGMSQLAWVNYKGDLLNDLVEQFYYPISGNECSFVEKLNKLLYFLREEINKDAFLFVDNVNATEADDQNLHLLNDFRCNVICTSRIQALGLFAEYDLDFLSESQCVEMFESYYRKLKSKQEEKDVRGIVQLAGLHTLTIEAIAKVSLQDGLCPSEILYKLKNDGFDLSKAVTQITHRDEVTRETTIINHLKYVFNIATLSSKELAVLKILSLLPNMPIPSVAYEWFDLENINIFNHLAKYAWLKQTDNGFFMHHVIKEVIKDSCKITINDCKKAMTFFIAHLQGDESKSVQDYNDLLPFAESLLEHFSNSKSVYVGFLSYAIGQAYFYTGKFSEAMSLLNKAYKVLSKRFPDSDKNVFSIFCVQASIENCLGNFADSAQHYLKAIKGCQMSEFAQTTLMADIYRDTATNLIDMGESALDVAIQYQEMSITIYEKNEAFLDMASVYNNLGLTYYNAGNSQKALNYYILAEKLYQGRISADHQDFATLYNNIAMVLCDEGKLDDALGYHLKALSIRNKFDNDDHIELSETYNNIATVFARKGDYEKAIEYQALDIIILEKINLLHPYLKQSYQKMSNFYHEIGNAEKSNEYFEKAQTIGQ